MIDESTAKAALQADVAKELNQVFESILPWTLATNAPGETLQRYSEDDPEVIRQFLKSIYLFKITEVSVADEHLDDAISRSLGKRHQALVTAAYQSDLTIVTVIIGQGGGVVSLYVGASGEGDSREIFEHQLKGIFPGKGIELQRANGPDDVLERALSDKEFGGIITGIPPVRLENERQAFDLTSVIRSMHGQPFLLMTVARPVPKEKAAQQIMEIMRIKDTCHSLVNRTIIQSNSSEIHQEKGDSKAESVGSGPNQALTKSVFGSGAGTAGINWSNAISFTFGIYAPFVATATYTGTIGGSLSGTLTLGGSLASSQGESSNKTSTTSHNESSGWSKSIGESLQLEQQNSLAMELEHIADKLIRRLRIGLNSGIWEVFLTYATSSNSAARILSGALCGELLKADPDALPSRNLLHNLPSTGTLYLPTRQGVGNLLKSNPLVSHVSSEEAAILLSSPLNSVPGFDIRVKPALSLTDSATEGAAIGAISEHGRQVSGSHFVVSSHDVLKHIFVAGITGSGKTTTVKRLLGNTDVPFLVLESAKREYRRLLADEHFKDNVRVFTVGDSNLAPFRHNPFVVLPGVSALTHIDHLKSIFNASFSLYGPMPYLLEQCLHNIFRKKGWNLTTGKHHTVVIESIKDCRDHCFIYPTIRDLITEVNSVVDAAGYAGELRDNIRSAIVARMESLAVGAKGFIFNTYECVDIGRLLNHRVVFELESLADDDDKAFFVGLILSLISEYRQVAVRNNSCRQKEGLQHILVIEEAHRLLKHINTERTSEMLGNPKGKAVETFCNIIAEMRSFGQGVVVAEQIPTKIAPDVIKNTNTKIIHRLVSADDQKAVGASLGLPDSDCQYLNQLSTGYAIVHKEGMARPIEVVIHNTLSNQPVGDDLVSERICKLWESNESGLAQGNIIPKLNLHESGLLDSTVVPGVARRLINTIFLSKKELPDALPVAIVEVRRSHQRDFLLNSTIVDALEFWFKRILLSSSMDMGDGRIATEKVIDGINRFWHEPLEKFNRDRLVRYLDQWRGNSCVERIRDFAAISVVCEIGEGCQERCISAIVDREFLLRDVIESNGITDALRKRIL